MTSDLNFATIAFLIALTAAGYAVATLGMKLATGGITAQAAALMACGLAAAVAAEILLLRNSDLSVIYIGIIAFETILVLAIAAWLGEGLTFRQLAGAGLVLGGMMMVTH